MIERVYVAGNYSRNNNGETASILEVLDNIRAGQKASLRVMREGFAVFCPWLDYQFHFLDDEIITDITYKRNSLLWLAVSDCMLVISGEGHGGGVDYEIEFARMKHIPVFYDIDEFFKISKLEENNES